ncbi:MAG: hypothetical protein RL641_652 [Candidatus Parcubacteria bacterium]
MRRKSIDNFRAWREEMKIIGVLKSVYPPLVKNGDLAELIGVTLGDGHICKYPRTEELRIISNANNPGFIKRYANLIEKVFGKKPTVRASNQQNSVSIGFYEKQISRRIGIPTGARLSLDIPIPAWISKKDEFVVRYLRGLYEAEGSFCVHKPTSTYKLFFSNRNASLLDNVYYSMQSLGFHPHRSKYAIQLSRKAEVYRAIEVLGFRKY